MESSIDPAALSHYQILGINLAATPEDIRKAYREKARQYHPDKNPEAIAEEWMKQLNKAYSVLSDNIQRADYNECKEDDEGWTGDPVAALPQGKRLSEDFMKEFLIWTRTRRVDGLGLFPEALTKNLKDFLQGPYKELVNTSRRVSSEPNPRPKKITKGSSHEELSHAIRETMDDPSLNATAGPVLEVLIGIVDHSRTSGSTQVLNEGTRVPIIDLSSVAKDKLRLLLHLFTATDTHGNIDRLSHEELVLRISEFVPHTHVQQPPDSQATPHKCNNCKQQFRALIRPKHPCFACGNHFCNSCLPHHRKVPHFGQMKPQRVCQSCCNYLDRKDMEDWVETGLQTLKAGKLEQLRAALGCFTMAVCSYDQSNKPIIALAKELLNQGLPEMAMPLVVTLAQSREPKEALQAYLFQASALKSWAYQPNTKWDDQWQLMLAAKEAYNLACEVASSMDSSTEVPDLATQKSELDSLLHALVEQKEHDHKCQVRKTMLLLDLAWQNRDWEQLLAFVSANDDQQFILKLVTDSEDCTIEALECFLKAKEGFLERMIPEDRFPLIFLRSIVKLSKGQFSDGLADIEIVAWSGHHTRWLSKATVDIVLALLDKHPESVLPLQAVNAMCEKLASGLPVSGGSVLLPTAEELNPPSAIQWPELIVPGHNIKALRKYEQAVIKQVQENKMTEREAALAYIDFCVACDHPAEVAMSFLIASFWFLKELRSKATKATSAQSEIYSLKKAVLWCVERAYAVSHLTLHPGMQLYVSRLALGAALAATQLAGRLATPEDSKLVVQLLHTIVYSCRFCPFWHAPAITVSEALLLNILSGRVHSEFILGLQHFEPDRFPMHVSELRYQLYENDLRHLCPLQDSPGAHARAMEEMLREKGWSWEDVVNLMTSPLTPRTSEGWLVQQPSLGTLLEYAELKGFVLNLDADAPSIELLVVPSDGRRGKPGLLSRADVDTVLQLNTDDLFPIYFSLDAPSTDQHFHPFQQFRYADELAGTDLLHTLFHTDYLMKSFSVGSDVSAKPPFNQRPCSESLTAGLPPKLQRALRPVKERGYSHNRMHRFWIQADELVYDVKQSGSRVEFLLGKPKMIVRSHPLFPGLEGKLQDTPEDDDPDSPAAQFANDLTANYDEIGKHFPMFARLEELCKLQFLGLILESILKDMQEKAAGRGIEVTDRMLHEIQQDSRQHQQTQVANMLRDLRRQVGVWPAADDWETRRNAVLEIQRNLPQYASYDEIEPHVQQALRQKDQNTLTQVVDAIMESCPNRLTRSTLQMYVTQWLSQNPSSAERDLMNFICSALPLPTRESIRQILLEHHRQRHNAFRREVERLQVAAKRQAHTRPVKSPPCKWVPAALHKQESDDGTSFSLCYGGVLIAPKIRQGTVPPSRSTTRSVKIQVQNTNRSAPSSSNRSRFSAPTSLSSAAAATLSASSGGHQWDHVFARNPEGRIIDPKKSRDIWSRIKDEAETDWRRNLNMVYVTTSSQQRKAKGCTMNNANFNAILIASKTSVRAAGRSSKRGGKRGGNGGSNGGGSGKRGGNGGSNGGGSGSDDGGDGKPDKYDVIAKQDRVWQKIRQELAYTKWRHPRYGLFYEVKHEGEYKWLAHDHDRHGGSLVKMFELKGDPKNKGKKRLVFIKSCDYDEEKNELILMWDKAESNKGKTIPIHEMTNRRELKKKD